MKNKALFMTRSEAGVRIGVTAARVRQLEQEGRIATAATTVGGRSLFDPATVEALVKEREARRRT